MTDSPTHNKAMHSKTIVLVGCTKQKRDGTHKARDLYDESPLFRKRRVYADRFEWYILSAKYGLIWPEAEVETYDTHITEVDETEWAESVLERLDNMVSRDDEVRILAGKAYVDPLTPGLEAKGVDVIDVNRGLMPGERLQKLNAINRETANHGLNEFA